VFGYYELSGGIIRMISRIVWSDVSWYAIVCVEVESLGSCERISSAMVIAQDFFKWTWGSRRSRPSVNQQSSSFAFFQHHAKRYPKVCIQDGQHAGIQASHIDRSRFRYVGISSMFHSNAPSSTRQQRPATIAILNKIRCICKNTEIHPTLSHQSAKPPAISLLRSQSSKSH
jgi:hypothetical protein